LGTFPGFSKEFCAHRINVSTNRKRGIALCCLHKSSTNSKGFGVKWLQTFWANIILKGELKNKKKVSGGPSANLD
jgi:hypothetical protein